jgi:hypothetical protein
VCCRSEEAIFEGASAAAETFELRPSRIALDYLRGWLLIDLLALAPSAFEVYAAATRGGASTGNDAAADDTEYSGASAAIQATRGAKLIKLVRIARIFKLLRLARMRKLVKMLTVDDTVLKRLLDWVPPTPRLTQHWLTQFPRLTQCPHGSHSAHGSHRARASRCIQCSQCTDHRCTPRERCRCRSCSWPTRARCASLSSLE